jgi:hypothetical protein
VRTGPYSASMAGLLAIGVLAAGCGANPAGASAPQAPQVVTLCGPRGVPATELRLAQRIVTSRLLVEIGPQAPAAVLSGSQQCISVRFRRHITGIHTLAGMLAERGVFVQGIGVPPSPDYPKVETRVRYTTDPLTTANQYLPVERRIFGLGDVVRSSVTLQSQYVWFHVKPGMRRMWRRFTASHSSDSQQTLFDRVVMNSWLVSRGASEGVVMPIGYPSGFFRPRYWRLGPKALFAYLRFGPLPFQWRRVTISS